jgi:outer membrane protein, heavy metal efflux system
LNPVVEIKTGSAVNIPLALRLVLLLLPLLLFSPPLGNPQAKESAGRGSTTLATLLEEAKTKNQEYFTAEFQAQRYAGRIELAKNLDDSLLAYYYLGFPARILRDESAPPTSPATERPPSQRGVKENIRGKTLFERSSYMINAMAENRAAWYKAVSDDVGLQIARRVKEDFYQLYFQDRIIAATEENLTTLDNLLQFSRDRYAVNKLAQSDVLQAQTEKSLLRAQLLQLRQKRLALASDLNYLAARETAAPLEPTLPTELTHAQLAEFPHALAELTSALRNKRPLVRGYRALQETFTVMRLMIPMYFDPEIRRNGLLEVDSGLRSIRAELADFQNKVTAELVTNEGELKKNLEVARLYGDVIIPEARQIFAANLAEFKVGRAELRAPLQALLTLNRYQIEYYQALSGHQATLAKLEGASGMDLF